MTYETQPQGRSCGGISVVVVTSPARVPEGALGLGQKREEITGDLPEQDFWPDSLRSPVLGHVTREESTSQDPLTRARPYRQGKRGKKDSFPAPVSHALRQREIASGPSSAIDSFAAGYELRFLSISSAPRYGARSRGLHGLWLLARGQSYRLVLRFDARQFACGGAFGMRRRQLQPVAAASPRLDEEVKASVAVEHQPRPVL